MRYMSPNVLLGQDGCPLDDIYSFGITMWQLISRQIPYAMLDCNDLVAYNVVKLNMRPDSINLQRRLSAGTKNFLSPSSGPDFFSPKPILRRPTNSRCTELRKCSSLSKCCLPQENIVFKTPEQQSGHLLPTSLQIIKPNNLPNLRNHKPRRSQPYSSNKLCPKKLIYSPGSDTFCPTQLGTILENCGIIQISEELYRIIYRRCWHTDATKRPSTEIIQMELSRLISPS